MLTSETMLYLLLERILHLAYQSFIFYLEQNYEIYHMKIVVILLLQCHCWTQFHVLLWVLFGSFVQYRIFGLEALGSLDPLGFWGYFCLTNYQTTNFRLFQTERVCRWQFQIWRKWKKVIQTGRKHWEKEKLFVTSNFSFSQCFQKACFTEASKGVIVWESVKQDFSDL